MNRPTSGTLRWAILSAAAAALLVFGLAQLVYAPNVHCAPAPAEVAERPAPGFPTTTPIRCAENANGEVERLFDGTEVEHWFVPSNGITWHVVTAGERGHHAVVLLHGFPESWFAWHRQIAELAATHYVVAPDIIPFGQSDKRLDLDYRYRSIAVQLLNLLDEIGVSAFSLVTHDRGSVVGDHLAAIAAGDDRVRRYVRLQ